MSSKGARPLLDVDPSIIENNLLLPELNDSELDTLFPHLKEPDKDEIPWKPVKPKIGFCVKTKSLIGDKVFINICHTDEIPPPEDISDDQLLEILSSDEAASYRLPISIGDLHTEADKSGQPASVYDVAVNSTFFNKVETNKLFRSFFMTVVLEGIQDKYNLELDMSNYVILKNRKCMGSLQYHRIQQRGEKQKKAQKLIEELDSSTKTAKTPKTSATTSSATPPVTTDAPKFRIVRDPPEGDPEFLVAQVFVKDVTTGKNLTLDVGEDRLILRSQKKPGSLLDIFLPYSVDEKNTVAQFNKFSKILSVTMPVLQCNG